jgi:hypothetical protein
MTTFIKEMQFAAPDETLELTANIWWSDYVVVPPNKEGRLIDLFQLL